MGNQWVVDVKTGAIKFLIFLGLVAIAVMAVLVSVFYTQLDARGKIVLTTGGSDGAYSALAQTYIPELARNGIELQLRDDLQGSNLLKALRDPASGVDGGIIKGGYLGSMTGRLASVRARDRHEQNDANVVSVGRLFLEPIWVFTRGDLPITSLRDLKGKRIITGMKESGARRVVNQLLRANGVNTDNSVIQEGDLPEDAAPLNKGEADAAVLVLPPEADRIQRLLRVPNIRLMNFAPEANAYTSRFPALSAVVLHRGSVEFEPVVPSADITLLATSSTLVVRRSLHPAVTSLLASTVLRNPKSPFDKTGDPILFFKPGQFPTADDPEYDVTGEVRQVYKTGELPVLLRVMAPFNERLGLPFAFTTFVNAYGVQSFLFIIPVLTLFWPLAKAVPAVYRWTIRQRLLYWYRELKSTERNIELAEKREEVEAQLVEIERVDMSVQRIRVPLEFADQFYDLRSHIDLVRRRLSERLTPLRGAAADAAAAE